MISFIPLLLATVCAPQVGGSWLELQPLSAADRIIAQVALGDFDGDGTDDLLVGVQNDSVQVLSGRTGAELLRVNAPTTSSSFGSSVAALGNLDGDLVPDFAVGAGYELGVGVVRIYSGVNGTPLHTIAGGVSGAKFGWALLAPGDLDGDGRCDLLVTTPGAMSALPGTLTALSGATAAIIHTFTYSRETRFFGDSLASLGDVNRDLVPDYVISAPDVDVGGLSYAGEVLVCSGTNGQPLRVWIGDAGDNFGKHVGLAGDADGDQFPDLYTDASIYSIRSGVLVRTLVSDPPTALLDGACMGGIDFTGDGMPDLVVGSTRLSKVGALASGGCFVYDPRDGRILQRIYGQADEYLGRYVSALRGLGGDAPPDVGLGGYLSATSRSYGFSSLLSVEPSTISAASGGVALLDLHFPKTEAGKHYLLLASATGTGPTQFGGIQVPLGNDALYLRMLTHPPRALQSARGMLDPQSVATARLALPPGTASAWIGLTIQFAAVTHDGLIARLSSTSQSLTILP